MATYSMTAFAEAVESENNIEVRVEIKSLNSRFLDINIRLPSGYSSFELDLTKLIKAELKRGKVDVYVSRIVATANQEYQLNFNEKLFESYMSLVQGLFDTHLKKVSKETKAAAIVEILKKQDMLSFSTKTIDQEKEYRLVHTAFKNALSKLRQMRELEGVSLNRELSFHLDSLKKAVSGIEEINKGVPNLCRDRLLNKLKNIETNVSFDETRVAQEIAILIERGDITEELARLHSHFDQFAQGLVNGGGGKKLEFLLQEIGREINTVGSKSQHTDISNLVIEAKVTAEKLREQVSNIE